MDFFIVGTSRSGSTLLRNILNDHHDVAVLNESHWLPNMQELVGLGPVPLERLIDIVDRTFWDSGRPVLDANLELSATTRDVLMQRLRSRLGPTTSVATFHDELVDALFNTDDHEPIRGDKTPDYGFYMQDLQRIWPEARFVHVVRNGLDTAISMSRHRGCRVMVSYGHDCWSPVSYDWKPRWHHDRRRVPLSSFVASWRRRMDRIRAEAAQLRPDSYLEIRYEHLVSEPGIVLKQVSDFLAIEPDQAWLSDAGTRPRPPSAKNADQRLFATLSTADLRALGSEGGVEFLLYEPDLVPAAIEAELQKGRHALDRGDDQTAAQIGFSLLAVAPDGISGSVMADVGELVRVALVGLGSRRAARSWAARFAQEIDR